MNIRVDFNLYKFISDVSNKLNITKSKLANNMLEYLASNQELMKGFNKEIDCIVEEKQLRDGLDALRKLKSDLYVVDNFMNTFFDKALKHYRRYQEVNIDVLKCEWDFFKSHPLVSLDRGTEVSEFIKHRGKGCIFLK